uniref:Uncharacterized protein n=1 Tax=Setaria viridis TaxID=4556 RepID=A0A4V6D3R1_SETVI|nr:hypothetical protein SEVIR_7G051950v2 [Setaria viridis]
MIRLWCYELLRFANWWTPANWWTLFSFDPRN